MSSYSRPVGRAFPVGRALAARAARFTFVEGLEPRALLATDLGLAGSLSNPIIAIDGAGETAHTASYDASTHVFDISANGTLLVDDSGVQFLDPLAELHVRVQVDSSGNLIGGVAGDDLTLTQDADGPGGDPPTVLLTGEVRANGFAFNPDTAATEFLFQPTGGTLAGEFTGAAPANDIGLELTLDSAPLGFGQSFSGSVPKGYLGAFPAPIVSTPFVPPSSLAGTVYTDTANDGVRQSTDVGISGASVSLFDASNTLVASVLTDATGHYSFPGLLPGDYKIVESQPANYLDGKESVGTVAGVTCGTSPANDTFAVALAGGEDGVDYNFGELPPASLSGVVYADANDDGVRQSAEAGLAGIAVTLGGTDDLGGSVSASTQTLADGSFAFAGLRPGNYSVTEPTQPAGYVDGLDAREGAPIAGSRATDTINGIVLTPGSASANDTFGEVRYALSLSLVKKTNGTDNDAGTGPIVAVGSAVTWSYVLTNTGNVPLLNVKVVDDNGTPGVTSDDLWVGTVASLIPGATATLTAAGTAKAGQYVNVGSATASDAIGDAIAASNPDRYFGAQPAIAIVKLTNGTDNNSTPGLQISAGSAVTWTYKVTNAGNVPLSNVTVSDDQGVVPTYASGDANNNGQLDSGETWVYTAGGTAQAGQYTNVGKAAGTDAIGEARTATDVENYFGTTGSINGYVYYDSNNNGIKDAAEAGLANVTVKLSNGSTTLTNAAGYYEFAGLLAGIYSVAEPTQPAGYLDGLDNRGNTAGGVIASSNATDAIGGLVVVAGGAIANNNFGELKPASISGYVYTDCENDGVRQSNNVGIANVSVSLLSASGAVVQTTATDPAGKYTFGNLTPGVYTIVETQPAGYTDGKETIGTVNGTARGTSPANDKFAVTLAAGDAGVEYDFAEVKPSSLAGYVWTDFNDDGKIDFNEDGIAGVGVTLYQKQGAAWVKLAAQSTDALGHYEFDGLLPGSYKVVECGPTSCNFEDGSESLGTVNGVRVGTVGCDTFSDVTLNCGDAGVDYDFGERPVGGCGIPCGDTGTVCFYAGKSGKALITSLNGSSGATQLGNWLAATFPNMYGATSGGKSLAGKTDAQVYDAFTTKVNNCAAKLDAQVMALAFSVYVTSTQLVGNVAAGYGFRTSQYGVGDRTFSICCVCTNVQVLDLLFSTDDATCNGVLYGNDGCARAIATLVYTVVNEAGDAHCC